MNPLPFITNELPGSGGILKSEPAHFVVEEIPLYEPEGEGEHIYVTLRREGQTTRQIQLDLCRLFELQDSDVGTAGLKDKHAVATQTISLLLSSEMDDVVERIKGELDVEVLSAARHRNKLKTGHLLGNRFGIVVTGLNEGALGVAEQIAAKLAERGFPNFYGPQRFGRDGDNAELGRDVLRGKRLRQHWLRKLMLSAYQAQLFNEWLIARIERDWFAEILCGDIARKEETGGMFEIEDLDAEVERFRRREISYTGPIYGKKMRKASGQPGELEAEILDSAEITDDQLRRAKLTGTRRRARLFLDDLSIGPHPEGLLFQFSLPKGSYATTVLREFMKSEVELPEDGVS